MEIRDPIHPRGTMAPESVHRHAMESQIIRKSPAPSGLKSNLGDYAATRAKFTWAAARAELDGLPGGGLNIAYEALDRHLTKGRGDKLALRWLGKDGTSRDFTYAELARQTSRFANALRAAGVGKGDIVFIFAGRVPELYIAALGALKNGSVASPLFSVFGPEPVKTRMERGGARALVTTRHLYEKKVAPWRAELPSLRHHDVRGTQAEQCPAAGGVIRNQRLP